MKISAEQIESLNYFLDKVVTFIVPSINRKFDETHMIDYFVGKVSAINEFGFWFKHIQTGCKNFIYHDKIISIAEEQVITEAPEKQEIVEEEKVESPKNLEELQKMFGL